MHKHYGPRLRTLHCCTDQVMTYALAEMELTAAQGRILGFLSRRAEPPCPRDIEEAFQLSHPTVSGLLNRLEKKGFIKLRTDPSDKRRKRVYILPKGEACNQHMHETIDAIEHRLVQDFTPEEQEAFTRLLDRAITNMGGSLRRTIHKEDDRKC